MAAVAKGAAAVLIPAVHVFVPQPQNDSHGAYTGADAAQGRDVHVRLRVLADSSLPPTFPSLRGPF
jgi:hypothetical protein